MNSTKTSAIGALIHDTHAHTNPAIDERRLESHDAGERFWYVGDGENNFRDFHTRTFESAQMKVQVAREHK